MNNIFFPLQKLWFAHVVILVVSNYAVQLPVDLFGINTTVGTFTYPFVFLSTDLTVRIFGKDKARKIVFIATMPALVLSYFVGTLFEHGQFQGWANLTEFSYFVFRITLASLCAYLLGQISEITKVETVVAGTCMFLHFRQYARYIFLLCRSLLWNQ